MNALSEMEFVYFLLFVLASVGCQNDGDDSLESVVRDVFFPSNENGKI